MILAAGASSRMGRPKLLLRIGDATLLERAIAHCAAFPTVVVGGSALRDYVPAPARFVAHDEPERGMTHSLRLASAAVEPDEALLVVPADLPFLDASLVARVAAAPAADVAYPQCSSRPGHPVRFSAKARALLHTLPEGDTLRMLRDDPALRRVVAGEASERSQRDIDTEADFAAAVSPA